MKIDPDIYDPNQEDLSRDTLISLVEKDFVSTSFARRDELIRSLFKTESSVSEFNLANLSEKTETGALGNIVGSDIVYIEGWKNIANISARLIDFFDKVVVLECLIDKDQSIYEEREFTATIFEDFELAIGKIFLLRFFSRRKEIKMEVHDEPGLVSKDDFPEKDFRLLFKNSKLFK